MTNIRIIEIDNINTARKAIAQTGADKYSIGIMAPKAIFKTMLIENVDNRAAALLKQTMLSIGGEAAVSEKVSRFKKGTSKVLLMGTLKDYAILSKKLSAQPFGLKKTAAEIITALSNTENKYFTVKAGKFNLQLGDNSLVMGILNVTPDSFSDGGRYSCVDEAVNRALEMENEGAAIIDVGGESTKPGAKPVSEKEEIKRVIPVIKNIVKKVKVPVSVDTYKPAVAKAALDEGASIVNDITAMRYGGTKMASVAVRHGAAVILMHMLGNPGTMQKKPVYNDVVRDIMDYFYERIAFAERSGCKHTSLLVDPGIGFGKTSEHNAGILKKLKEIKILGMPLVVGLSRKSFIGNALGGLPSGDRLFGSISGNIWSALNGANILRVHDVKETVQALKIIQRIRI